MKTLSKQEYSRICNDTLSIKNDKMELSVKDCDGKKVRFSLKRTGPNGKKLTERLFEFDIRYYEPVRNSGYVASGLYVFKTEDKDSRPFDHAISKIQVFQGKLLQQMIIHYKNPKEPRTVVKIRLQKDHLEFDVFLARLAMDDRHPAGYDVTVNWQSLDILPERPGLFYTDANAYKIIKRDVQAPKNYSISQPLNKVQQVASYFYPINAGLFIEDKESKEQMLVMNDRP